MTEDEAKAQEVAQKLVEVRKNWLNKLPEKITQITADWQRLHNEPLSGDAALPLYQVIHNLSGSSGVFGFAEVGVAARRCEIWLRVLVDERRGPSENEHKELGLLVNELLSSCQQVVDQGDDALQHIAPVSAEHKHLISGEQHLIYLVEDDLELAAELKLQLGLCGFHVEHFDRLEGFITAFKRQEPAAVIMDVALPDGEGTDALRAMQQYHGKPINSVFITVRDDIHTRLEALRVGAEAFLTKPLDINQLIETLGYLTRSEIREPYRVLLVEDSFSLSRRFSLSLEGAGMEVKWVSDPFQVFAALVDFLPDLILLDLYLPGCNGQELAELVRQQDSFVSIPIVYLSSTAERKKQQYSLNLSGEDFLEKTIAGAELVKAISSRAKRSRAVRDYLSQDSLTGLPNRNAYRDRLRQILRSCHRTEQQLALAKVDINQFKKINDTLGNEVGDLVLQQVANRLQQVLRPGDLLCRLSGDEFAVLFLNIHDRSGVKTAVGKLTEAVMEPLAIADRKLHLSVSTGVSFYPDDALDAERLNSQTDLALHAAKEQGHGQNALCFFEPDLDVNAKLRLNLEAELRLGLDEGQFELYYQPKLSLVSGEVIGMEALVRWQHPERGLLLPDQFIPIAEDCGLITPLGAWILEQACHDNQRWIVAGFDLRVAVNLSSRQFQHATLLSLIDDVLARSGMAPEHLELEITESMVMHDVEAVIELLDQLRSRGVFIAVDDFGTGYSSLNYLKRFPIHTLKIDQSFIKEMHADESDRSIVKAIISLGQSLKLHVVAEGVEELDQLKMLESSGCESMQGFYFSRPLTREAFDQLLNETESQHPARRQTKSD